MEELKFKLEVYEGPLDLMLSLIAKHKLNIYDIEISLLLEQFMLYLDRMKQADIEIAGEFLEMAARLIYIKTVSLLPKPEEAEEIKKELQGTLIEYSACKRAAEKLKAVFCGNDLFVREPVKLKTDSVYKLEHPAGILAETFLNMHIKKFDFRRAGEKKINDVVQQKAVSVISKVVYVIKTLYQCGSVFIENLFDGMTDRSERVATFLAVLELTKSGRIVLNDDNTKIYFKKKGDRIAAE